MAGARSRLIKRAYRRADREAARVAATVVAAPITEQRFNPHGSFVYLLWESHDAEIPLYVGMSDNLVERIGGHLRARRDAEVGWVSFLRCQSKRDAELTEDALIKHFRPPWNKQGKPPPDDGEPEFYTGT